MFLQSASVVRVTILFVVALICISNFAHGDASLPPDEEHALYEVGKRLGVHLVPSSNWHDYAPSPCYKWYTNDPSPYSEIPGVVCNCSSANNTVCHVVSIKLYADSLPGVLPTELVKLPFLQQLDIRSNSLNGTIPPEWGIMCNIVNISLYGNGLTGPIPKELGNLSTLKNLDISYNDLSGAIPAEWGKMSSIVEISLYENGLTGPIPKELGNLSTLKNLDIRNNNLNGTIPPEWGKMSSIVEIHLYGNRLTGPIPKELGNLSTLESLDISYNYHNGAIPPEWGKMSSIVDISLYANRLTGPIPKELGNLSTLESLDVRMNRLSGLLPPELGNLTGIKQLLLRSNKFTGELPSSFAKLIALTDLWLGDNSFTGQIPDFIQNLINLETLEIQASGLQGPIPDSFELLKNLTDLRISDLNGPESQFPRFYDSNLDILILRSCNLSGNLPEKLPSSTFTTVDFSFNRLTGVVPSIYSDGGHALYLFLSGNQLSGTTTNWNFSSRSYIDISYNNFTLELLPSACQEARVNMFASSSKDNTSGIAPCLGNRCSNSYYNLYINCGGKGVTIGGIQYDYDLNAGEPSQFFSTPSYHWGYSNTGYFMIMNAKRLSYYSRAYYAPNKEYTISNASKLSIDNPLLYMNARASPISLTYYAFCLMNGNYTLSLHFAEIEFTDDETYGSVGRRIFDVYIQGKVALKDFDIAAEAGGVGKKIVKNFTMVLTDSTLEIRLYWAGKGTTSMPSHRTYGPLISAISLNPNFIPTEGQSGNRISTGAVVGIVVAVVCFVSMILGTLWWRGSLGHKETTEQDLKGLDLKTDSFTLKQIKAATNNFDPANKIGEGGFGSVYKGFLLDGTIIAVKQLSSKSKQGNREFVNEIGMISALQHPHLVKLYGCCTEGNQLLLVYEYMENNNLARALFGPVEHQLKLDWTTRYMICIGIARGLAYLHGESRLKIVHRDIKSTNVLLDKHLNPKISDFGLAKLNEEDNTHISTRIAGTLGYMAPEYAMRGYLTDKADVYSFGIVVLEIICGMSNTSYEQKDKCFYLLDWANVLKEKGDLMELVDPRLGSEFNKEEAMMMINVALLCTNVSPAVRPTMSSVVSMLEGKIKVEAPPPHAAVTIDEVDLVAMRKHFRGTLGEKVSKQATQSIPMKGPQPVSSTSANDLYSINLDSDYLLGRD